VGLGNPGTQYARTRHNAGADAVALVARRHGATLKRSPRQLALVADVRHGGRRLVLAFPQTYMNESGRSVSLLLRWHRVADVGHLVVVHDELDLPLGRIQVKVGGGLAGHNGLRSIRDHLHSADFLRVRIGIGKPPGGKQHGVDHVLRAPSRKERSELDVSLEEAADAVECLLDEGVVAAQNRFNG
jgi:PTH1 family peptidyl-tRNA hydrolase